MKKQEKSIQINESKKWRSLNKHLLGFFFVFAFGFNGLAQDKITLRNGTEISCRVNEIGEYEIKYTVSDSLRRGQKVLKKDVFMIVYENGVREVFKQEAQAQPVYVATPQAPAITQKYDSDTSDFAKIKQKKFGGPRVGFTYVGEGINAHYLALGGKRPSFVQIGWQFETVLFSVDNTAGLVEVVPLIGGFEQGLFLPSLSVLLGLRGGEKASFEFALGPNFSVGRDYFGNQKGRVGLVLAAGTNVRKGNINFPITFAIVPSVGYIADVYNPNTGKSAATKYESGWRFTLLVGFNSRQR